MRSELLHHRGTIWRNILLKRKATLYWGVETEKAAQSLVRLRGFCMGVY